MKFNGIKISELEPKSIINGIYILKKAYFKTTATNKKFIDLELIDETGKVSGKIWDTKESFYNELKQGKLYYINGRSDLYREEMQITIQKIQLAGDEDQKEIGQFVPSAPIDSDTMFDGLVEYVNSVSNNYIQKLLLSVLEENKVKLLYYPAAKSLHHAIRGGLLYHLTRMMQTADKMCQVYENINKDLLYAGIILHDIEKLNELSSDELGISEYSKEGQLLGHIVMGVKYIENKGKELGIDEETILLIQHMITSHHYHPEFGSPKYPMILEAEILHYIDLIDARVYDFNNISAKLKKGEFSDPIWSLDKRRVYKPNM